LIVVAGCASRGEGRTNRESLYSAICRLSSVIVREHFNLREGAPLILLTDASSSYAGQRRYRAKDAALKANSRKI
jgi:hypothetical protein